MMTLRSHHKSRVLYATILSTRFGRGSETPLRSAIFRILGVFISALAIGFVIAGSIRNTQLPASIPLNVVVAVFLTIGFILGGFALLATGAIQQSGSRIVLNAMLILMPLKSKQRWFCVILPVMIIWCLVALFGFPIILTIAPKMGVSRLLLSLTWVFGLFCGMAGQLARQPSSIFIKTILFIGQVVLLLVLFDKLLQPSGRLHLNLILSGIYAITGLQCYGLVDLFFNHSLPYKDDTSAEYIPLIPKYIPFSAWFLVKLWRNQHSRTSFAVALLFTLSTAITIEIRGTSFSEPYGMLILGAILASLFACDIRGMMKRNVPPEIVLLRGARSLVKNETFGVLTCGFIIGFPMYFALHQNATDQSLFFIFFISVQIFSSILGLLASTVFVPSTQDTGAQFFSAVSSAGVIVFFPRIAQFSRVSVSTQIVLWSEAAATAWILIYILEIVRRKHYGRT